MDWSSMLRRLLLLVSRGRVQLVDDAGAAQAMQVQVSTGWVQDKLPRLSEYGFQSVPPAGSDAVLLFIGGNPSDGIVVATGNQTFRMRGMATGEVALSDDKGQSIYLSASGIRIDGGGLPIEISNTPSVTVDSPVLHCTGDITADGSVTGAEVLDQAGAKSMSGMRTTFNSHKNGGSSLSTPPM